jgi:hypothetical protein
MEPTHRASYKYLCGWSSNLESGQGKSQVRSRCLYWSHRERGPWHRAGSETAVPVCRLRSATKTNAAEALVPAIETAINDGDSVWID